MNIINTGAGHARLPNAGKPGSGTQSAIGGGNSRSSGGQSSAFPGLDLFSNLYSQIFNMMSVPTISVPVPSRASIEKDFKESMRPGVDLAIADRRDSGERTKAELDADAAARGMTGSTFLSSMKEREGDDVDRDITTLETQYSAALAERIQDAMMEYRQMSMQAQMFNAQMYQTAASTAMGVASDWYTMYLSNSAKRSSGSGSAAKKNFGPDVYDCLTMEECDRYVKSLSAQEKENLFTSNFKYWADRRNELEASLGDDYDAFCRRALSRPMGVAK